MPRQDPAEEFRRQQDLLTPADLEGLDVDIVGAGALGGACLLSLMKMGFGIQNRLTITDFDRCEMHNLATQWFRAAHVLAGEAKVDAVAELADWIADREIVPVRERFTGAESRRLGPVVILAVDSLEERRRIWANLRERDDVRLLIDPRMGGEVVEIHLVEPQCDVSMYEASLEGEPAEVACTARSILYAVLGAAAFVGSLLRGYARGEPVRRHLSFDFRNFFIEVGDWLPGRSPSR